MRDLRELSVHHATRAHNPPSERLPDRLMAQTDAEDRYLAREALDERHADARFGRCAGPRRDDDSVRLPRRDLAERERVVAIHAHVRTQLAQVLHQVVGEAVVVVDHQQHGGPYASWSSPAWAISAAR